MGFKPFESSVSVKAGGVVGNNCLLSCYLDRCGHAKCGMENYSSFNEGVKLGALISAELFQSRPRVMLSEAKHLLCRAQRPFAPLRVTSAMVEEQVSCRCQGTLERPDLISGVLVKRRRMPVTILFEIVISPRGSA